MAATPAQAQHIVAAAIDMATKIKAMKFLFDQVLANNSAQSIAWASFATNYPSLVDANGQIILPGSAVGLITPTQMSNVISSKAALSGAFWTTNGGIFELVTTPTV